MKIPVWIYRPGADEPEKTEIEVEDADYSDASLRVFVKETLYAQRASSPEHVHVLHNGGRRSMFVDEFGTGCYGHKPLPANDAATEIYWAATRARGQEPDIHAPRIHGVAVLFPDHHVWS